MIKKAKNFSRIQKATPLLKEWKLDAFIIEDPINIFYLTGIEVSLGTLLIQKKGAFLFLDGRYLEAAKKKKPTGIHVVPTENFRKVVSSPDFGNRVGFDEEKTSFFRFEELFRTFPKKISLCPIENFIKRLRIIKSEEEIALMKKAATLAARGFHHAVSHLQKGITEQEVAKILKIFWLDQGAEHFSFEPIVAFGKNSACPHHRPTSTRLKKGDAVLFDLGVTLQRYASDMTRTLFFGNPDPELITIYEIVLEAKARALKKCKPSTPLLSLDSAARGYIKKRGYGDQFPHSLGHGIGLEVHEAPLIPKSSSPKNNTKKILETGMLLTIEPGIYLPSLGGVRLEDTIIITDKGYESITPLSEKLMIIN